MKQRLRIAVVGIAIAFIAFAIYKLWHFSLFDVDTRTISITQLGNEGLAIGIFYLPSNATSQEYIHIRRIYKGSVTVIANFERYDTVVSSAIWADSSHLKLILKNAGMSKSKQDTFFVRL